MATPPKWANNTTAHQGGDGDKRADGKQTFDQMHNELLG
jgi:hypothetical protein